MSGATLGKAFGWWLLWLPLAGCASQQERALAQLEQIAGSVLQAPCPQPEYRYRAIGNPHAPERTDEIETLHCPGLEAQSYLPAGAGRLPVLLQLDRPHAHLPGFLQPGSPGQGLIRQLGPPARRTPELWRYASGETTETVTIEWLDGLIRRVRWEWYLD